MENALLDEAIVAQVLGQRKGRELIELYVAEAEQLLGNLASIVAQGDLTGAQQVAHGLKSSSRYVGAAGMAKLSQEIEALSRHGALKRAPQMVAELQRLFEGTREQLLSRSRTQ